MRPTCLSVVGWFWFPTVKPTVGWTWPLRQCVLRWGDILRHFSKHISAGGQRRDSCVLRLFSQIPSSCFHSLINMSWIFPRNCAQGWAPPPSPSHPLSVCPQASFKAWLGLDHYIKSIRHSTEDFEGMLKGMASSESSGGVMPGVKVSDITFAGVPVRVYEPPAGGEGHLRRGLIYFHGGGWALGTTSEYRH